MSDDQKDRELLILSTFGTILMGILWYFMNFETALFFGLGYAITTIVSSVNNEEEKNNGKPS